MTDLTPTELARLHTEGSVRVVRKCEPQPDAVSPDGIPYVKNMNMRDEGFDDDFELDSPFPPAGTREVIDGVGPVVWGEYLCTQKKPSLCLPNEIGMYYWVGHIRKEERA